MVGAAGTNGLQVPPLDFECSFPTAVSKRKLTIMKIIAQYSVINPQLLAEKVKDNEYDFVEPSHVLYPVYQQYVNQYKRVVEGAKPFSGNVLQRAIERSAVINDSNPVKDNLLNNANNNSNSKRGSRGPGHSVTDAPAVAREGSPLHINWHNFLVLETVNFFSQDINGTSNLSAPLTLEELKLERTQQAQPNEPQFKSPITGELVPASKFNEHIRIHTLDPQYYQQKRTETERSESTNLDADNAADNVFRLAEKRRKLNAELQHSGGAR